MFIAKQKKDDNIAEYVLYMWQIEDLIRANKFDIDLIKKNIIDRFDIDDAQKIEMQKWYQELIDMMHQENIKDEGHLQITKNVIINLTDLHLDLLKSPNKTAYIETYYKTLPFIVELRAKAGDKALPEIDTCFSALYLYLMLRLQKKQISGETQAAIAQISSLLRILSEEYKSDKNCTEEKF